MLEKLYDFCLICLSLIFLVTRRTIPLSSWGMGVDRIFFGGGNTFSKNFSKNSQKTFKKYSKNFLKYSKNISKYFRKFLKIFLRKLQKRIVLAYFSKNLTNHALIFYAFGRKRQCIGNFEKIFENFKNFSSGNC